MKWSGSFHVQPTKQMPASAPGKMTPLVPARRLTIDKIDASTENVDTGLLFLSPELLQALRKIAPKRGRRKVRYIVGLVILANVIAFAAEKSTRNVIVAHLQETAAMAATGAHDASSALVVAPPAATGNEATVRIIPTGSATPAPPAAAPTAKKTNRRAGPRTAPRPVRR